MIYLDNAATSFPKPKVMVEAMTEHMLSWCGNPGRSGHTMSQKTAEAIYETRKALAELFRIKNPERIIFTQNTTGALNQAIQGTLKAGDHVITTAMEHNSVLRPIAASPAEYTIVSCSCDGTLNTAEVQRAIRPNTKMLVCTHASNVTGTIMPIRALSDLCRRHKILFLVDAAQSAGHMPVTAEGIDMLAAPGHKGLMGPMGTGFLYSGDHIQLSPLTQGGTGTLSKELTPEVGFPDSFENGTVNAPGIIGLGASLEWIKRIGIENIYEHQMELTKYFDEALRNMENVKVYGPEVYRNKVGITTFNIDGIDCEEVASLLNDEFGIAVRAGFHCAGLAHKTIGTWDTGAVRVSVGFFTTMRQMRYTVDAIYSLVKGITGARPSRCLPVRPHGCSSRLRI